MTPEDEHILLVALLGYARGIVSRAAQGPVPQDRIDEWREQLQAWTKRVNEDPPPTTPDQKS